MRASVCLPVTDWRAAALHAASACYSAADACGFSAQGKMSAQGVPSTDCGAVRARSNVASPRSPILTTPWLPLMNMLSHFRSLWMIGGVCPAGSRRPSGSQYPLNRERCSGMA